MRWIKKLRTAMHDDLTPAAQRLLDAILELAVLQDGTTNKWAAPKEDVLDALQKSEGRRLDGDAWRQRLQTIRRAINASDALKIEGRAAATIKSEKHAFVIEWAEGARESLERDETRSAVGSSGRADYQINIGALEPIAAELQAPVSHTVFLSHNWEAENVNEILDAFANLLANKLRKLPSRWVDKISVNLVYDRDKGFHSRADFSVQADELCNAASFGLWMTSDGWCQSEVCQQEASIFKLKGKIGKQNPYLCVQLLGDRKDLPAEYRKLPNLPSSRSRDFGGCKNLLEIWNQPESLKDDFVSAIRDEICEYLEQLPSIDPEPGGQLRLQSIRDHIARRVHFKLDIEKARRVEAHFTIEDGDDNKVASDNRPLAVDRLYKWATDDDEPNRIVFLLGGFGMGKTTTVQVLHERLQANWQDSNVPTPIYLDFRRLIPLSDHGKSIAFDMPTLVHAALHSDAKREVTGEQVVELIRSDRSLVIFDGLDEVGNRIGREAAAQLYRKFLELIPAGVLSEEAKVGRADWTKCQTRLILTCRTHFFRDLREQTNLLSGSSRMAPRLKKGNGGPQVPGASTFYMAPFRMEQIAELFKNALGEDLGGETFSMIRRVHDLSGLASRPIMARFISEVAGELVERHKQRDPINIATIYEELFLHGLERDAEKRPLLKVQDRGDVLKALAFHLQSNGLGPQTADELERWFDAFAHKHIGISLVLRSGAINARDILHTELENASFLVRGSDDRFSFAHTSYQEYFLALAIAECDDIDALERIVSHPISAETRDFVHAIGTRDRREPVLVRRWLDILRSNRAMLLRRFALDMLSNGVRTYKMPAGANLSGMDLRGFRVSDKFDWANVNLGKAQLNHLDARNGRFRDCDFQDAVLANARFENVEFESCEGMPIGLESARGVGTVLPEKWKHETKITDRFWTESTHYRGERITLGSEVSSVRTSPDGTRIVTASHDGTARLWDAETGSLLHALEGHRSSVWSAEFSPDGTRIVTASRDGTARLWDAETGSLLHTLEGHGDLVQSAEFSPDGTRIVTASRDGTARLWDAESGSLLHTLKGHGGWVWSAEFSPDGTRIVTASRDGTARLWDAESGSLLHTLEGHGDLVQSAEFSPDGTRIVTASHDKTARLWDAESGSLLHALEGHRSSVQSAEFSPDGTRIVTASRDGTARLWDAESGSLLHTLEGHGDLVQSAEFSPDGTRIVTASRDKTARLWDAESGSLLHTLEAHGDWVQSAEFSPDGTRIVTASHDKTARLWDAESGSLLHALEGHGNTVQSAEFSPDGTRIVTASRDGTARLWDAESGSLLHALEGHRSSVQSAEFSPDGTRIVTASDDQTARLWDAETGSLLHTLEGHGDSVWSAEFSPDGTRIVTASYDETARLWDAESGSLLHTLEGHRSSVQSAEFSPDGTRIVTASYDKTARLWDAETGSLLHTLEGHGDSVWSAEFSPDGTRIVTASYDGTARLWDAESGSLLHTLEGHGVWVQSAEFSPDGTRIVTASHDKTARLWDAESGSLLHALEGHGDWVQSAEFSPDGTRIVTASFDGTARLWDAETGSLLHTLEGHGGWVWSAEFSPDGTRIVTASYDGTARLWDAESASARLALIGLPESWCSTLPDGKIASHGQSFWRYVA